MLWLAENDKLGNLSKKIDQGRHALVGKIVWSWAGE